MQPNGVFGGTDDWELEAEDQPVMDQIYVPQQDESPS